MRGDSSLASMRSKKCHDLDICQRRLSYALVGAPGFVDALAAERNFLFDKYMIYI